MKNSSIISAIVGATFTAIPLLGFSVAPIPSVLIGAAAYGASELMFKKDEKNHLKLTNRNLYDVLQEAKAQNTEILKMVQKVEPTKLRQNIREISETATKIIQTIEQKPEKYKKAATFFDYYLPVTLKILTKYDEIENQRLGFQESEKFMKQAENMITEMNQAFQKQLANLYQSDMVDTDAEMKVIETMLKADGFDSNTEDFTNIKK